METDTLTITPSELLTITPSEPLTIQESDLLTIQDPALSFSTATTATLTNTETTWTSQTDSSIYRRAYEKLLDDTENKTDYKIKKLDYFNSYNKINHKEEHPCYYYDKIEHKREYETYFSNSPTYTVRDPEWYRETNSTSTTIDWYSIYSSKQLWVDAPAKPVDPVSRIREVLRQRSCPAIKIRGRRSLSSDTDVREQRARTTLRRMIGEKGYRRFLKDGFVTLVGKTGLVYCIHPGHKMTDVYDNGKLIDRACVVLNGNFPPTDSLIMRYLLILNDEERFNSHAISHRPCHFTTRTRSITTGDEERSLPEIWSSLKLVA